MKKIIFAPGCFDNFEGTQDELDAVIKEITEKIQDGSLEIFGDGEITDEIVIDSFSKIDNDTEFEIPEPQNRTLH